MKRKMKRVLTVTLFAVLWLPLGIQAQQTAVNDLVYYDIGGGQANNGPLSYRLMEQIDGTLDLSLNYSCGSFDLKDNLEKMFNNLRDGVDDAVDTLIFAATSGLQALPLYLLRQANPNLADMLENAMLRYEQAFKLAVKDCEQAEREIMNGENPYSDWVIFGENSTWKKEAEEAEGGSDKSILDAQENAKNEHGCIYWINGQERLCNGQPIHVVNEVVSRGHEYTVDGTLVAGDELGVNDARLLLLWPTLDDAIADITDIAGEYTFTNLKEQAPVGNPGRGASPMMYENAALIKAALELAIEKTENIDATDFEDLPMPNIAINQALVDALKKQNDALLETTLNQVSLELAMLNTMEKINAARRLLITGSRDPNVAFSPAKELIDNEILPRLEAENRLLRDEYDLNKRVAQSTFTRVIARDIQKHNTPVTPSGARVTAPIQGGAIIE